jgi:hypothetical protein
MSRLTITKSLSFAITVCLLITCLPKFITSSFGKTKDQFYKELDELCYPNDIYDKIYETYATKDRFYWTNFFMAGQSSKTKFIFRRGTTFFFKNKEEKSVNMSYSSNQAIEFYQNYVDMEDYEFGVNTEKSFLNNPESRHYLMRLDGCTFKKTGLGYNYLHYAKEKQYKLVKSLFENKSEEEYSMVLVKMMYQLARSLLYIFNNDHYLSEFSAESVKYTNLRNFNSFKFNNPTKIR